MEQLTDDLKSVVDHLRQQNRVQWPMISLFFGVVVSSVTLLGVWMDTRLGPTESTIEESKRDRDRTIEQLARQDERWSLLLSGRIQIGRDK